MMETIINAFGIWTEAQGVKSKGRTKNIDNISLEGLARLRELILELAIRGKLVPQDPKDEPASALLKKIRKEKDELIKEGKIKKIKSLPLIEPKEYPHTLPNGWLFVRLNEVGEWGSGSTPDRGNVRYYGGTIPWFKSGELISDFIEHSEEFLTELALKENSLRYNSVGDVLVAMYGATIGKTSIIKVRGTTNQAVCACTPFKCIFNIYLLTLLKASRGRFIKMGAGGAQPNISREKIIATVVAIPPLQEQHRIVAKVNELMALCDKLEQEKTASLKTHQTLVSALLQTLMTAGDADELESSWQRLASHFDTLFCTEDSIEQLKQTILQLAVMGRLVKQDPNDEPASVLLKKIQKEKDKLVKQGKIKKEKSLPEIKEEEKPFALPKGWEWVRLGNVTNYGSSKKVEPGDTTNDTWILELEDVEKVSSNLIQKVRTSQRRFQSSKNKFLKGDVIYGKLRPYLDKVLIADEDGICTTEMIPLRAYLGITPKYLRLVLKSKYFIDYATNSTHGMNLPRLGTDKARLALLPLVATTEQHRIVAKVNELMALCDRLKERLAKAQEMQNMLSQTLVEGAIM